MTDPVETISQFKSKGGLRRVFSAIGYSITGLRTACRTEHAFRQELVLSAIAAAITFLLPLAALQRLLLIGVLVLVMVMELVNSAIEAVVDRVSLDTHPLSKNAKDFGSAAVFLMLLLAAATWMVILLPVLAGLL